MILKTGWKFFWDLKRKVLYPTVAVFLANRLLVRAWKMKQCSRGVAGWRLGMLIGVNSPSLQVKIDRTQRNMDFCSTKSSFEDMICCSDITTSGMFLYGWKKQHGEAFMAACERRFPWHHGAGEAVATWCSAKVWKIDGEMHVLCFFFFNNSPPYGKCFLKYASLVGNVFKIMPPLGELFLKWFPPRGACP